MKENVSGCLFMVSASSVRDESREWGKQTVPSQFRLVS